MKVAGAVVGSLIWLVVAPGAVAVGGPWLISRWRMQPPFFGVEAVRWLGALFVLMGLPVLLEAFARFALNGRGTPAPVLPPERLVVQGFYRYVRNPMYVSLIVIIIGEGLILGATRILVYAAAVWLAFHLFVMLYEEPTLAARFGADYHPYHAAVPRWIPRLIPWRPGRNGAQA